jgi:precorrin-3B synthase
MNAGVDVKGWCPGALRPMPSGDGLLVRIRPFCGALNLDQAAGVADLAARLGNGHIDLTRRANLQIRGLTDRRLPELLEGLDQLGLIDRDATTEARRNLMVAPLAGLDPGECFDVRPIAAALDRALAADDGLQALPAKFGFAIDGGGRLSIAGERADISLAATDNAFAFGLDTQTGTTWLGSVALDQAVPVAIAAARAFVAVAAQGRMRDHVDRVRPSFPPLAALPQPGRRHLGLLDRAVGVAAPFGRLEARQLQCLAALASRAKATELRLSPWRSVYIGSRDRALLEGASAIGLIVDDNDPLLRIDACPGAPDCVSGSVDTRRDARRLAALAAERGYRGSIHVSGCAKSCARSLPADLTFVGEAGRYRVGQRLVSATDLAVLFKTKADG